MIFATILLGLFPSFLMVAIGGLVRNRLSPEAWQGLDRLNFEVLFPALLFFAACGRPIAPVEILRIGPAVWTIMLLALALGYLARRLGPDSFLDFAGAWQTSWRFNTAVAFVAIPTLDPALIGQMAIAVGMAVPVANILAVTALSRGGSLSFVSTLKKVMGNPFLIASVAGVAVGVSGYKIPAPLLAPAIVFGLRLAWQLGGALSAVFILFAALPTASAAHVLASGFGADRRLVATLIAQSTLLAAVTLPLWILATKLVFLN